MKGKNIIVGLIAFAVVAGTFLLFFANEEVRVPDPFGDSRQKMADELKACKNSGNAGDWSAAQTHLNSAKTVWTNDVKPEFSQNNDFENRASDVETHLSYLTSDVSNKNIKNLNYNANYLIYNGLSALPQGWFVPKAEYTVWDWIFAVAIGLGFNAACIAAGLHLRRTYKGGE